MKIYEVYAAAVFPGSRFTKFLVTSNNLPAINSWLSQHSWTIVLIVESYQVEENIPVLFDLPGAARLLRNFANRVCLLGFKEFDDEADFYAEVRQRQPLPAAEPPPPRRLELQ